MTALKIILLHPRGEVYFHTCMGCLSGAVNAMQENGLLGILTGGTTAAAAGISAAVVFGFLAALLFRPKMKQ